MGCHMRRREFIRILGGMAAAWPLAASAQQGPHRIAVLMGISQADPQGHEGLAAFKATLAEFGWVEGRNLQIDVRWGETDVGRIQDLAKELIALKPDLI